MPQTIMLAVHCKKAESLEFKAPLVEYARAAYGPEVGAGLVANLNWLLLNHFAASLGSGWRNTC